jgi:hypothetical protein
VSTVVFYISGHGFGHASRDIEVINALGAFDPSMRLVIRTSAPRWLFDLTVRVPHEFHPAETDSGIVQHNSLTHDIPETVERAAAFYATFRDRVEREAEFLRSTRADLVVGDIPPLAFAAGAGAGVAACALGNFTWDWIYEDFEEMRMLAPAVVDAMASAYSHAREAWRLPMHGGFASIPQVIDVPFVARHSHREPEETRRALGLPLDLRLILSSFGGYGLEELPLERVDCLGDYAVVVAEATTGGERTASQASPHVFVLAERAIYGAGFRYEDLVRAVDVVITKPGFGIIAECLANDTTLVYTSRGRFREYAVLVEEMPKILRCAFIEQSDLFAGRWRASIERALSSPPPPRRPPTNGADVVSQLIARQR